MPYTTPIQTQSVTSPLMLADQLLTMAQAADRAGMRRQARSLVRLALDVCTRSAPVSSALN